MTDDRWVMDVSHANEMGLRAFCPLDEDDNVVVGLTMLTDRPPGPVVGVFHVDGQEAVDAYCEEHADELEAFFDEQHRLAVESVANALENGR